VVKGLVDKRPELARSVWEWRFGDFESAIGAASHVGRRDIALYLISKGARPTLFTFAMLGYYNVIKSAVDSSPGLQMVKGPHGISLLEHAYAGERMKGSMRKDEFENLKLTIQYLESIEGAGPDTYIELNKAQQEKYLGNYYYGSNPDAGFTIGLNMRNLLSLGPIDGFGGAIYKIDDNLFTYNGTPSVSISFSEENNVVRSLTLTTPEVVITARKLD